MTPIDFQIRSLGEFRQVEIIKEKIINLSQSDLEAGLPPILESNNYHDVFSALGLAVFQKMTNRFQTVSNRLRIVSNHWRIEIFCLVEHSGV